MKRRPRDENAWFAFNSLPDFDLFFVCVPFFESESLSWWLFHLLQ
jgi:hypothetical protein